MTDVERVELAPGYSIARIINGCWQLTPDHGGGPASEKDVHNIFAELVANGYTTFDCADIYTGVEELIGRFRAALANPDSIQVHTKYVPDRSSLCELSDQQVDDAIDRSLRRLGVERIDLLQFHWWDYQAPGMLRVCERLHLAQQRGKIHLLGLTNFSTGQAQNVIDDGTPIASIQTQYSLLDRRPQRQLAAYCAKREIGLLTYGVLAGGFLVDRYLDAAAPRSMNRSLQKYRLIIDEVGGWPVLQALLNVLGATAKRLDTSIAAVATRWVLDQTAVAAVILGTGSCSRAAEHRRLQDLQLDEQARQELGALLADQPVPPGDVYELERDPHGMHARVIKTELRAGDA